MSPEVEDPPVGVHGVVAQPEVEVHDAAQAEEGQQMPRLCVEGGQVVAGRDHEDRGTALDLGVGHSLSVVLARRGLPARVVPLPPHPEGLARGGIDRHDRAALAGHGVEPVADLDGGAPIDEVRLGAVVGRVPAPGHLELADVLGVDLVEGRIAAAPLVPAPVPPLAFLGPLGWARAGAAAKASAAARAAATRADAGERAFGHGFFLHLISIFLRALWCGGQLLWRRRASRSGTGCRRGAPRTPGGLRLPGLFWGIRCRIKS